MDTIFLASDTKNESESGVPVYWGRGGLKPGCWKGVVYVPVEQFKGNSGSREKAIVSELLVLRYLLLDKQLLGFLRGGAGVGVEFSIGQPRKLAQKKSKDFAYLWPYAEFLRTVFSGLSIKTGKFLPQSVVRCEAFQQEQLSVEYGMAPTVYESTSCGAVHVTDHALKRFIERHSELGMGEAKNPYKTLLKLLKDDELRPASLPEKVIKRKERKYWGDTAEHWRDPDSPFWFVVARNKDGSGELLTVFCRQDKYAMEG